jgi:molybdopterin synthase catalytic subunit
VREAIDPRAVEAAVRTDACGGVVSFLGVVRERSDDLRPVTGLSYEAYESMALAEFEVIAEEARARFGDVRLAMVHRVGDLVIGDIAVVVCAASPHRGDAFKACEYSIDELKARAAIWKKEHYADGAGEWKSNTCATDDHERAH